MDRSSAPSFPTASRISAPWRRPQGGLLEIGDGLVRLYLPWGPDFGCFCWRGGAWRSDAPDGPLFDRRGAWLDPPGPRDDFWQAARVARAAYFSRIPWPVRLAAARASDQWAALNAAARSFFPAAIAAGMPRPRGSPRGPRNRP